MTELKKWQNHVDYNSCWRVIVLSSFTKKTCYAMMKIDSLEIIITLKRALDLEPCQFDLVWHKNFPK